MLREAMGDPLFEAMLAVRRGETVLFTGHQPGRRGGAHSLAMVTVAERLAVAGLTPAERKVARVLLADYPVRGLEPVAKLAAEAGVSRPDRDPAGHQARVRFVR